MLNSCLGCLEDIMPDPEDSPECQELHLGIAAAKDFELKEKAYRDYLDQPLASPEDEYAKSLESERGKSYVALLEISQEQRDANCK